MVFALRVVVYPRGLACSVFHYYLSIFYFYAAISVAAFVSLVSLPPQPVNEDLV